MRWTPSSSRPDGEQVFTLESADKPYRLLVAQMPHPAATLTADGTIISCNHRFADLLLRPLPSLLGQPIHDFVTPDGRPVLEALLRDGLAADTQGKVTMQRADGAPVPAYLGVRALREGALGLCLMVTDLTEQRHYQELQRTQEALRASEERLDLAQRSGRIGSFEWNIRTGAVSWSATKEELYGLPAGGFGGRYEDWKQAVHPDDRDRAEADRRRAVAEGTELDTEFRIVRPDGADALDRIQGEGVLRRRRRAAAHARGEPGRHRAQADRGRTPGRRPPEGRVPGDAGPRAAQPAGPDPQRRADPQGQGPRRPGTANGPGACIERQVQQMVRLLDDLLDVSRITRKQLELRKERVELAAVLEAAVETSRPLIEAGSHELTVTLPPEPIHLDADPLRLAQVFANLLNNAAKYTERRRAHPADRRAAGERRGRLGQGHRHRHRRRDAAAHLRDVLAGEAAHGAVAGRAGHRPVAGEGAGRAARRQRRGPQRRAGPGERVRRPPAGRRRDARPGAGPNERRRARSPRSKYRILIVDDNQDSADSLAMLLQIMGNEIRTAYDGEQAVEAAEAVRPDVVLLDIGMPKLNGYEACRRIREQPWGEEMFLIALTGWGQEEDRRRTEEAGFDRHMVKPVDADVLMKLLATLSLEHGGQPTKR